jgi:hypothetical protein
MSHMTQPTLTVSLLLALATVGCQNPSQPAAPRSEPAPRANTAEYQPQNSPSDARDVEGTGRRRRPRVNSTSICSTFPGHRSSARLTPTARNAGATWAS